ncbi:MAG: lnt [Gemmataceae bacterium]|nr:lnt [Gemmataceae bacterium]
MKPRVFLPAILSGVLLWAAFFPLDVGPVAFVALVPWLTLVRSPASPRRVYFAGYVGGLAFFLPALNWLRVAHPMMYLSWVGLSLACPVFWVAALWLLRRVDRLKVVPLALSVPVVWVALEYVRAHFPTGFPFLTHVGMYQMVGFGWYFLGYSQHDFLSLVQIADLGGVYAVSFVVAAVNGLGAEWVLRCGGVRSWLRWPGDSPRPACPCLVPSTVAVGALFAAAVGYGRAQLVHPDFQPGPRVAAIQGSVPQFQKNLRGEELGDSYKNQHAQALRQSPRPDLIIWPETCCPIDWYEVAPGDDLRSTPDSFQKGYSRSQAEFIGRPLGTHILLGLNGLEWEAGHAWKYNSALALGPGGEYLGRYDKMHLVPFGEYVPFKETFPWMSAFTPYTHDYSCRPGERWTRFPVRTADGREFTFGCLICYEDSDPYLARKYAGPAEPVNFLVNISNDGWFDGTEEHEQHLAICRFRAVETRRSVVRAVNMGISAVIDADGRVVALPGESWAASKKTEAVLTAVVPIDERHSWYARLGDWVPAGCWGLLVVGHLVAVVRRRRAAV